MKEYHKVGKIFVWFIAPILTICTIAFEFSFDKIFPWSEKLFISLSIFFVLMAVFSPLKYYCGVVSLRVTENAIQRLWLKIRTCSIPRDNAFIHYRIIFGLLFMVFSKTDLSHARTADIIFAVLSHKAIVFPFVVQIKKDFPEWFE